MLDNPYFILIALVSGILFLCVSPKYKLVLALFVMSSCFDLVEHIIAGIDLWDVGFLMLFIAYVQLLITSGSKPHEKPVYEKILIVFIVWTLIEFAWSLSQYPLIPTIKIARQLVLGYMTYFVYLSFFKAQNYDLEPFFKLLYWVIFLFVILFVAQSALHVPILKSLEREYEGITRSIPGFLAYAFLFTWYHLVRYFSGEKLSFSEYIYLALMIVVIMGTYTRSVYFGVMFIVGVMLCLLVKDGKLQLTKVTSSAIIVFITFMLLFSTGKLDKMIDRTLSGLQLISGDVGGNSQERQKKDDSYSGRIAIVKERFFMGLMANPVMGYGFVHDDIAFNMLKLRPRSGSIRADKYNYKYTNRFNLTIYSADATWGNIIINTGITGLVILIVFIVSVIVAGLRRSFTDGRVYYYQCAFLLQFIYTVISSISSNALSNNIQIPCLFLAGYTVCLQSQKESGNNDQIT